MSYKLVRIIVCDGCQCEYDIQDTDNVIEAFSAARNDGWTITRRHGQPHHYCPRCSNNR